MTYKHDFNSLSNLINMPIRFYGHIHPVNRELTANAARFSFVLAHSAVELGQYSTIARLCNILQYCTGAIV